MLCLVIGTLAVGLEARTRPRLQQPIDDAYEYEPQGPQRGGVSDNLKAHLSFLRLNFSL